MLEVLDSEKQSRRWVEAKIKSFDPETEYAEIVSLMAQYQLDEFTLNFLVTILTSYTLKPSHMAETLSITNKGLRRPNQRMQDTLDFFGFGTYMARLRRDQKVPFEIEQITCRRRAHVAGTF